MTKLVLGGKLDAWTFVDDEIGEEVDGKVDVERTGVNRIMIIKDIDKIKE